MLVLIFRRKSIVKDRMCIIFTVACLFAFTIAENANINVSLETTFEFNRKDKYNDLKILDDIQEFIDYIRKGLLAAPRDKDSHKIKHTGQIVMQDDRFDLRKKLREKKNNARKVKAKSSPLFIYLLPKGKTTNTLLIDRVRSVTDSVNDSSIKKPPLKSIFNLFSMIIRSLDDESLKSVINIAHNKTQKLQNSNMRRAMNNGLTVLKETPVKSIREFLRKIINLGGNSQNNSYYKLNAAFENFFSELQWLMLQMDPDTASLLTLLCHDLEKIFFKELEKSKLKTLTSTNRDLFHKLRSNPYIFGEEDGLLDIVNDSLKSLISKKYGDLNRKEKIWVKSKLKPLWENVRKFFDADGSKRYTKKNKQYGMKRSKADWSVLRSTEQHVDSSVSAEDPNRSSITMALKLDNDKKLSNTFNLFTKKEKKKNTDKTINTNKGRFTVKTRENIFFDAENVNFVTTSSDTTTKGSIRLDNNRSKRNRSLNISRLTSYLSDFDLTQLALENGTPVLKNQNSDAEIIDEIDKANSNYQGDRNSNMQHRFRVLDGYNNVTVTRTSLRYSTTLKYRKESLKKPTARKWNIIPKSKDKTSHFKFYSGGKVVGDLFGEKPSRTTLKTTLPIKEDKKTYFRRDKSEDDESDSSSDSIKNSFPSLLMKRIHHIEDKIQNIEKFIVTKKATNWLIDLNFSGEKKYNKEKEGNKSSSTNIAITTFTTAKTTTSKDLEKKRKMFINILDNEVIDKPSAIAEYTKSSILLTTTPTIPTTEYTSTSTKQTIITKSSTTTRTEKPKTDTNNIDSISFKISSYSNETSTETSNKTYPTSSSEWLNKI